MSATKPTFRFISFTLTLLLLLGFFISVKAFEPVTNDDDDDLDGFEELLALDEQEEEQEGAQVKSAEAEVLSKAQRIVRELNNDNTKRIIDQNEFVLILGYAPWCTRSAELMPQFAEAAMALKEMGNPLLLAKLDADRYSKAASVLGIKGFPTLLLFVNGSSQMYAGGLTGEEIVIWARKKTGVPVTRLTSVIEANDFLSKHQMFVIGLFEKFEGADYEEFVKAAAADNEIQFVEASNIEVAKVLFPDIKTKAHFLGLVKSEPETHVTFEDAFSKDNIIEFLQYNKFPLVTTMTELNSIRVHASPVKQQLYRIWIEPVFRIDTHDPRKESIKEITMEKVFVFARSDEFKNLLVPLQDVARKFKSKILFVYVDIAEENLAKPFLTLFGHEESEETIVTAFDNKISSKFLLESEPTPSNLEEFCLGLLQGTLAPYFKSQPIPVNENATVQTVVGRTFDDLVLSSTQNVLLEVHAPWCIDCEATSKQIEKLAKHFKGFDNLLIARIDASMNEHPKLQITDFPMLLFYPSGDKSNPIKLSTKSSLKDLATFINKNARVVKDQTTKDEL